MAIIDPEAIVIDLDGTMVDSVPDLAHSVDQVMERLHLAPCGEAQVRLWVGNGVEPLVKRALTKSMDGEPDAALFAQAFPLFLEVYGANTCARSRLYPGIGEGLLRLKGLGYRLACVTNKAERFTTPLLVALGIAAHFELVIAGDSLPRKKPDPLPLLHASQHFGVPPQAVLMVGDSVSDVKAARAAGCNVVCVSYGYNHGEDIREAGPDAVIDRLTELPDLFVQAA